MLIAFELTGKTPILFHADDIESSDELAEWRTDPNNKSLSVRGDDRSPPWTWQTYLYSDGKHLTIPQENLMAALRWGGAKVVMTPRTNTTYKAATQAGIFPDGNFFEFLAGGEEVPLKALAALRDLTFREQAEGVKALGLRLLVKRAKVGQSKHVRVRLCADAWSCSGRLLIDAVAYPKLTLDTLRLIAGMAGTGGLGDWRAGAPKSPGGYGQFEAKLRMLEKAAA